MTKSELLAWLDEQSWTSNVGEATLAVATGHDNIAWYSVQLMDVSNDEAIRRNVQFYVVNEGENDEAAYWKDKTPTSNLTTETQISVCKWITYRTLLAALDFSTASSIISKLTSASLADPVMSQIHAMLSSYGGSEPGIDINNPSVQALITSLATGESPHLTQAEANEVIGLADNITED